MGARNEQNAGTRIVKARRDVDLAFGLKAARGEPGVEEAVFASVSLRDLLVDTRNKLLVTRNPVLGYSLTTLLGGNPDGSRNAPSPGNPEFLRMVDGIDDLEKYALLMYAGIGQTKDRTEAERKQTLALVPCFKEAVLSYVMDPRTVSKDFKIRAEVNSQFIAHMNALAAKTEHQINSRGNTFIQGIKSVIAAVVRFGQCLTGMTVNATSEKLFPSTRKKKVDDILANAEKFLRWSEASQKIYYRQIDPMSTVRRCEHSDHKDRVVALGKLQKATAENVEEVRSDLLKHGAKVDSNTKEAETWGVFGKRMAKYTLGAVVVGAAMYALGYLVWYYGPQGAAAVSKVLGKAGLYANQDVSVPPAPAANHSVAVTSSQSATLAIAPPAARLAIVPPPASSTPSHASSSMWASIPSVAWGALAVLATVALAAALHLRRNDVVAAARVAENNAPGVKKWVVKGLDKVVRVGLQR